MHAYLIVGGTETERLTKGHEFAKEQHIQLLDFPLQKIEEARALKKFLALRGPENTGILIQNIEKASVEAVNAMLKSLEEKDSYTFLLTASSAQKVLPTILSRCSVVKILSNVEILPEVTEFIESDLPGRLKILENYKVKIDAVNFVNSIILGGDKLLKNEADKPKIAIVLKDAIELRARLSANTNTFLQLTNFAISLDA